MAKIYISEFESVAGDAAACRIDAASLPPVAEKTIALSGSSAQSAAFAANTKFIRVVSDTPANIAYGTNPTATTGSLYLAAGVPEYFGVIGGMKLAAIQGA